MPWGRLPYAAAAERHVLPDPDFRDAKTMTADEQIRNMRVACQSMGWGSCSTDRFIRYAIEFLSQWQYDADGEIMPEAGGITIRGNDADGWVVKGSDYSVGGGTLAEALTGAIFIVERD